MLTTHSECQNLCLFQPIVPKWVFLHCRFASHFTVRHPVVQEHHPTLQINKRSWWLLKPFRWRWQALPTSRLPNPRSTLRNHLKSRNTADTAGKPWRRQMLQRSGRKTSVTVSKNLPAGTRKYCCSYKSTGKNLTKKYCCILHLSVTTPL